MEIPIWAEAAFKQIRPEFANHGSDSAIAAMRLWKTIADRFRQRWSDLEVDLWKAPNDPIRQIILEIALGVAWERGIGKHPTQLLEAARLLDELNAKIAEKAGELAGLFRSRQHLLEDYGLTDRSPADMREPDPFSLFGALEVVVQKDAVAAWRLVFREKIDGFLKCGHTPRQKPSWADMFEVMSNRVSGSIHGREVADVRMLNQTGGNKTEWSPWAKRMIALLDDGVQQRSLLPFVKDEQLACLIEVALDAPRDIFSAAQTKNLVNRYHKNK